MTSTSLFLSALLVLLLVVLGLDLRATGRPVHGLTGILQLDNRQASHCDGCRRAVRLRARPWVIASMGVVLVGLVASVTLATRYAVGNGLPASLLCLTALLAIGPLALANRRASHRVRESSGHEPGS
ncbi:hypothetical protein [Kytococcus schroeteri]|uniref:hypothetical protein n=1 Tax=Kytococcus schroeteri TaxID=138300 RepID=UPI0011425BA5|nr:hypothetical protein [Kytococcus schroeteri]